MQIRLSHLSELVGICEGMVERASKASISTWRSYYGHGFFEKATLHGRSIVTLVESFRAEPPSYDVAGICTLSRCVIEVHNAFAYLLEPGLSDDESELRHQLFLLNHSADLNKINIEVGIKTSDDRFFYNDSAHRWALDALERNPIFQSLDAAHRKTLLRGKSPYLVARYKGKKPLPQSIESAAYKLFSHNVHSYSLGLSPLRGGQKTPAGGVNMLVLAIELAIVYLATIALHYWRLRSRAVRILSKEDKKFLSDGASSALVEQWVMKMKRNGSL
jgi:hypothetical protein